MTQVLLMLLRNPETPDWAIRDALLEWGAENVANVYVVCGATGEYSDARDWSVAAFLDREQADALCGKLNDWCRENGLNRDGAGFRYELDEDGEPDYRRPKKCPLDPGFDCDSTGTAYFVQEIPLRADG